MIFAFVGAFFKGTDLLGFEAGAICFFLAGATFTDGDEFSFPLPNSEKPPPNELLDATAAVSK